MKRNSNFTAVALATAWVLFSAGEAFAAPVLLVCRMNSDMPFTEDEPTTMELDEAQGTVTVHFAATARKDMTGITGGYEGRGGDRPHVMGPLNAAYSAEAITFVYPNNGGNPMNYSLNRVTGAFVSEADSLRWACQPGKKQF